MPDAVVTASVATSNSSGAAHVKKSWLTTELLLHPMTIFFVIWGVMIGSHSLEISTAMVPATQQLLLLCALSGACYFVGWSGGHALHSRLTGSRTLAALAEREIRIGRVRFMLVVIAAMIGFIVLYNWRNYGSLPGMSAFGGMTTLTYIEYGRFKGVLYALVAIWALIAYFDRSLVIRLAIWGAAVFLFVAYIARGPLMMAIVQLVFLFCVRRRLSPLALLGAAVAGFVALAAIMQWLGSVRHSDEYILRALRISPEYHDYPIWFIWIVAYTSEPAANLVEFLHANLPFFHGQVTLDNALPYMMSDRSWQISYANLLVNPSNTVATYLGNIYLDFGYFGIIGLNCLLGLIGGVLWSVRYDSANLFIRAMYVSVIVMLVFENMLTFFSTIVQFVLAFVAWRFMCRPVVPPGPQVEPWRMRVR